MTFNKSLGPFWILDLLLLLLLLHQLPSNTKACILNVYRGKTYLECYNFFQQCKDPFIIAGAKGQNWVPFAAIFFKETALFCLQQHQQKMEDETDLPLAGKNSRFFFAGA